MKLFDAFSLDVMAELARPANTYDTRNAELVPGITPAWHVIETYAHCECAVANELIDRRFGIYLPEEEETIVKRGRKVDQVKLMFPGYIFVFVWLTDANFTRIRFTPGIQQFLMMDGKPVVVGDEKIDEIRAVENSLRYAPAKAATPHLRGKKKRWYDMIAAAAYRDNEIVQVRSWSPFQDSLIELDSEGRNQSLLKALGLSLVPS